MASRTFVCVDCKKEHECGPVGIKPKRCEPCKEAFTKKDQAGRRAKRGGKKVRGAKQTAAARGAGGDINNLLDARITEICERHVVFGKELVTEIVKETIQAELPALVDARMRAIFSGRVKA